MRPVGSTKYDIAVIGGGIIGLATAMTLARSYPGRRFVLLEKETEVARHQTGHNSGVIHAGIYYAPGSQKANFCSTGGRLLREFCDERGIPYRMCGKVIVAVDDEERPRLQDLYERGTANGAEGLEMVGPERLRELEPHAAGVEAIHSPNTGIIDFGAVSNAFALELTESGGDLLTGAEVLSIDERGDGAHVETTQGEVAARRIINCAGLHADRVARMMGVDPGLRIIPFRGEYFSIRPERRDLVHGLIYPVPNPKLPFLGVHFTRRIDGSVEAGPNAVLALAREGYRKTSFHLGEALGTLTYPGFWKMSATYWRVGDQRAVPLHAKALVPEVAADPGARNTHGGPGVTGSRRARPGDRQEGQPRAGLRHIGDRERHPRTQRAIPRRNLGSHHQPLHSRHGSKGFRP